MEMVEIPSKYKGLIFGRHGANLRVLTNETGAELTRKDWELYITKATKKQREHVKQLIGIKIARARLMGEFYKVCCFIDDWNLSENCQLKLVPVSEKEGQYRLRPSSEVGQQQSVSDSSYLSELQKAMLETLNKMKGREEAKNHGEIWCHFGSGVIRGPSEVNVEKREWSIDDATKKFKYSAHGKYWKVSFQGGVDFMAADLFKNYFFENTPEEYLDYIARYDLTFLTPCRYQVRCKVWVTKKDAEEKPEAPYTDVRSILKEIFFTDEYTRSRSRGWVVLPSRRYLQTDILFPGCEFDCRFIINEHAGMPKTVEYAPEEEVICVLAKYLSWLTLADDDPFGLILHENQIPKGFQLTHKRLSKRNVYRSKPGFSVILSKETSWSAESTDGRYRESTDVHLHCEEWDKLLSCGQWEPESLVRKLPEFLEFVKEVQCFVVAAAALKSDGVEGKVPPAIRARGPLALATYLNALADGQACVKIVPLMIVGQDRSGKTSVKKSLKGICFNPEEDSTRGIDVDHYNFKVTTEIWKAGKNDQEANFDTEVISFKHKTARWIAKKLTTHEKVAEVIRASSAESTGYDIEVIDTPEESVSSETPSSSDPSESSSNPVSTNTTDDEPHLVKEEVRNPTELELEVDFLTTTLEKLPDFDEVAQILPQLLQDNWEDDREDIFSIMWDFAGQSVYYVTHPLFLTRRAIYFLVYDLSRNPSEKATPLVKQGVYGEIEDKYNLKTNFDYLDFWMSSLASLVEQSDCRQVDPETGVPLKKFPAVFLVCTHADQPYCDRDPFKLASKIFGDLKRKPYGAHLFDVFCVDNTKSGTEFECKEIMRLREDVHVVSKELPHVNEVIPIKWLRYENVLRVLKEDDHKFVSLSTAKGIASKVCDMNDNEVQTLLNFLHDLRVLIHFDDSPELREVVFLDIQWLIDVFKSVITVRFHREDKEFAHLWEKLQEKGILEEKLLKNVWSSLIPQKKTHKSLIAIMEKFSLMCPWPSSDDSSNKHFLVPSMLQTLPPKQIRNLVDSAQIPSLFLKFDTGRVPPGLFPRFVLEFLQWCRKEFPGVDMPKTFHNFARFSIFPKQGLSVVLLCHSSTIEVIVLSVKSATGLVDLASIRAFRNQLTSIIDRVWQKFFWVKNVGCEVSFLCPVCSHGRVVSFCTQHHEENCEQEECLHFISESDLGDEMQTVCTNYVTAVDNRIQAGQFAPWISSGEEKEMASHQRGGGHRLWKVGISDRCQEKSPVLPGEAVTSIQAQGPRIGSESDMFLVPFAQAGNPGYCEVQHLVAEQFKGEFNQLQDAVNESKGTVVLVSEGYGEKSLVLPCDVSESLRRESVPPKDVVCKLLDISSLRAPAPEDRKWIRCLMRAAKDFDRTDVVNFLREIAPAGTTGGDEWKIVADKLGFEDAYIRCFDQRFKNPVDLILQHCKLNVGQLYDLLVECEFPALADLL
ncbi:uncharacterized protein LOC111345809 isoform X2 [Stylophora pistillata]|uniref:uncharacterized protein LOC111345809 isoform X2 n=1 Tax=Stylophora pistillata TaxID=50429 RepID=UPI000C03E5C0|nr:uncharacterized protein LOC111345809 isoform X2 [Stylophora pistillata]